LYGLGSIAQSASGLILLPLLTTALSLEGFGAYSLILLASSIASAIFYFGVTSALPRSYYDYKNADDRRTVFTTGFFLLSVGAVLQSMIAILFSDSLSTLLTGTPAYSTSISCAFIGAALSFINYYFISFLRLIKKAWQSVAFGIILMVLTIFLTVYLLSKNSGGVIEPFKAIIYAQLLIGLIFFIVYGRTCFIFRVSVDEIGHLLKFGLPIVLASFGSLLLESMDRFIVQRYLGLTEVGEFSAAIKIGSLLNVILITPFCLVWMPLIMEHRENPKINYFFTKILSIYLIIGGILIIFSALFSDNIFKLLLNSNSNSEMLPIFFLLILGQLIFSTVNFFSAGFYFARQVKILPFIYIGAALIKIPISLYLTYKFGLMGAAFSGLVFCIAIPFSVYILARKLFFFEIEWWRILRLSFAIIPSALYVFIYENQNSLTISFKIILFLLNLLAVIKFCFSSYEKKILYNYLKKGIQFTCLK